MTNEERDIEVYVENVGVDRLTEWVCSALGPVVQVHQMDDIRVFHTDGRAQRVALTITPGMEGGPFTSLHFIGGSLPWSTDAQCARQIVRELGVRVRSTPDVQTDCSEAWLEITPTGARLVPWGETQ
jgi:hypothetical protein